MAYSLILNVPKWNQTAENMQASGIWRDMASKVCGQIQRLAALKGRPCINSVQLLGDAYPADYKLPPEYRLPGCCENVLCLRKGQRPENGQLGCCSVGDTEVRRIPFPRGSYSPFRLRECDRPESTLCTSRSNPFRTFGGEPAFSARSVPL